MTHLQNPVALYFSVLCEVKIQRDYSFFYKYSFKMSTSYSKQF